MTPVMLDAMVIDGELPGEVARDTRNTSAMSAYALPPRPRRSILAHCNDSGGVDLVPDT
jgi:hypothetical protein